MIIKKYLIVLITLLFITTLVFALPGDWKGIVDINGVEPAVGTTVTVYSGTTLLDTTTTPTTEAGASYFDSNGFYIFVFEADDGADLNFKVCGINSETSTFSTGTHDLNISADLQANGITGCTCDGVCTGGHCVNPGTTGVCSSNSYYCNSNGSCETAFGETSSNCSADCSSGGTGGNTGGTSGGTTGGTTFTPGTTVIFDTTEILDNNKIELRETLEGMEGEDGNPLYSNSEITEMLASSNDFEFTRIILVEKIVSESGVTTYKVTITVSVKNISTNNLKDIVVVIQVPKAIASDATSVTSLLPFTTIVNDPILEFSLAKLNAEQSTDITYSATSTTNPDVNNISFADPIIKNSTIVTTPPITPTCTAFTYSEWSTCSNGTQTRTVLTSTPTDCIGGSPLLTQDCTTPPVENPITMTSTGMGPTIMIILLIILLIVVGGIYYLKTKKKKKQHKLHG